VKCSQCGAEVKLAGDRGTETCPYCGADVVAPRIPPADQIAALLQDANGDGIPDFVENALRGGGQRTGFKVSVSHNVTRRYVVNGVSYDSLDAMPEDVRRLVGGSTGAAARAATTSRSAAFDLSVTTREGGAAGRAPRSPSRTLIWILVGLGIALLAIWLASSR
jgi:hypothetical protein